MARNQSISPVRKKYPNAKPTVTSVAASAVTGTTVTAGGNVTAEGTTSVTERGICYSTSSNPTTNSTKVTSGTGGGAFSVNITGLSNSTTYYFRAYAINSIGTSYGAQKSFTTVSANLPIVTTTDISIITNTSAVSGGNVTSQGGSSVTSRGICYGLTANPTIANSIVATGSGTGSFTSSLTGLTINTKYYVRAYATNSSGTAYGNNIEFNTTNVIPIPFGLYIDDFDDILGNSTNENTLRDFLVEKNITQPIFYMGSLLSSGGNRTAMRAYNTTLNTYGIVERAANVTQASAVDTEDPSSKASFNLGCTEDSQKFTHMAEEIEFYKSNPYVNNFTEYMAICDEIKEWCDDNGVIYNAYYARCEDVADITSPEDIADYMVATFDTLMLVDYVSTAKFETYQAFSPSIIAQFQLIADAANRAGKVQKIQLIFAANGNVVNGVPTNMRTYYQANPQLIQSFNAAKSKYNTLTLTNKDNLNFIGQTIYSLEGVADL
ncbi:hypothetical protein [uncultured Flavobacterium sp.]|uniref:hypothetical protein n=1 Tax=uncultured Flavobacterium sp. TaxID=165435 RepID=UPI002595B70B|nr:hypothetical protein [uncultured Flavobacterium sp.]